MAWLGSPTTQRSSRSPSQASSRRCWSGLTSWNSSTKRCRNRQRWACGELGSSRAGRGAQRQQVVEVDHAAVGASRPRSAGRRRRSRPAGERAPAGRCAGRGRVVVGRDAGGPWPTRSRRPRRRARTRRPDAARSGADEAGTLRSSSAGGWLPAVGPALRGAGRRRRRGTCRRRRGRAGPSRPQPVRSSPAALRVNVRASTWRGSRSPVAAR